MLKSSDFDKFSNAYYIYQEEACVPNFIKITLKLRALKQPDGRTEGQTNMATLTPLVIQSKNIHTLWSLRCLLVKIIYPLQGYKKLIRVVFQSCMYAMLNIKRG